MPGVRTSYNAKGENAPARANHSQQTRKEDHGRIHRGKASGYRGAARRHAHQARADCGRHQARRPGQRHHAQGEEPQHPREHGAAQGAGEALGPRQPSGRHGGGEAVRVRIAAGRHRRCRKGCGGAQRRSARAAAGSYHGRRQPGRHRPVRGSGGRIRHRYPEQAQRACDGGHVQEFGGCHYQCEDRPGRESGAGHRPPEGGGILGRRRQRACHGQHLGFEPQGQDGPGAWATRKRAWRA